MDLREIPIDQLEVDPANARKSVDADGIDALAGSIQAAGLINPLTVIKNGSGYLVVAGQRRLMALKKMAEEKNSPSGWPNVPCNVVTKDTHLISLSENVMRVPAHIVDEFRAYAELGKSMAMDEIAAAFGISEHRVSQRLSLGNLAPEVLKALEANKIQLRLAEDLCLTTNHKRQVALMKKYKDQWYSGHIKSILLEKKFPARSAAFDAADYKGSMTIDLFGKYDEMSDAHFDDFEQALNLQTTATENRRKELEDDGWKWVIAWPRICSYTDLLPYDVEISEIGYDKGGQKTSRKYSKKEKAQLGCIVHWESDYTLKVTKGLLSKEDKRERAKAKKQEENGDVEPGSSATYSNAFLDDLNAMATQGVIHSLTSDSSLVKRIALSNLLAVAGGEFWSKTMRFSVESFRINDFVEGEMEGFQANEEASKRFMEIEHIMQLISENDRRPDTLFALLSNRKEFSDDAIDSALCWFIAGSFDADNKTGYQTYWPVARDCNLDWRAQGWKPGSAFFGRMSKPQMEFVLSELGTPGRIIAAQMQLKRADLQDRMSTIFENPEKASEDMGLATAKEKWIKAVNEWIPEPLRIPDVPKKKERN